jgi:hypothetical protein
VESHQVIFGALLIVILLGISCYFAWRQGRVLASLQSDDLPAADRIYLRRQAWIRLMCSGLMVVLAIMLATSFFLEEPAGSLVDQGELKREKGEIGPMDPEQRRFFDVYSLFWGFVLLVLLGIIALAAADFFAIRRYGVRQYRQIQQERKAMIENELARIRSQKNGQDP